MKHKKQEVLDKMEKGRRKNSSLRLMTMKMAVKLSVLHKSSSMTLMKKLSPLKRQKKRLQKYSLNKKQSSLIRRRKRKKRQKCKTKPCRN